MSQTFEVGLGGGGYAGVDVTIASVTAAGSLTATTTTVGGTPPAASGLSSTKYVNHIWTLTNSGVAFSTWNGTFNFPAADVLGGANTNNLLVAKNTGGTWSLPTVGTRTATSTQATGMNSFSDFYVGEAGNHTITASAGANGSISPSGAVSVANGGSQAFTITPDACYHVADVLVDGGSVGPLTSYTFTNVTSDRAISASFALNTYTITASAGANGSIAPNGATVVNCAGSQVYTITANSGYGIADVLVDGVSQGAIASYTFSNVQANHTISASFVGEQADDHRAVDGDVPVPDQHQRHAAGDDLAHGQHAGARLQRHVPARRRAHAHVGHGQRQRGHVPVVVRHDAVQRDRQRRRLVHGRRGGQPGGQSATSGTLFDISSRARRRPGRAR